MRAIGIQQPWAWAIEQGHKPVENRSRAITHKLAGRLAIHATKWRTNHGFMTSSRFIHSACGKTAIVGGLLVGGIICTVNVIGCIGLNNDFTPRVLWASKGREAEVAAACESPFFVGPFGWVFGDVEAVPFLPWRGSQGFFNVELPEAKTKRAGSRRAVDLGDVRDALESQATTNFLNKAWWQTVYDVAPSTQQIARRLNVSPRKALGLIKQLRGDVVNVARGKWILRDATAPA